MASFGQTLTLNPADSLLVRSRRKGLLERLQWSSVLDELPQLICLIDTRGQVLRANRALETWGLGKTTSIRGMAVHDMLHPGCVDRNCRLQSRWMRAWTQLQDSGTAESDYRDEATGRCLHLHLYSREMPYDSDTAETGIHTLLIVNDVTRRRQALHELQDANVQLDHLVHARTRQLAFTNARLRDEIEEHLHASQALSEAEKKYTCLLDSTLTGFYVIENDRIIYCNRRFAEIFGYSQEAIGQLDMQRLFPPGAARSQSAAGDDPGETGAPHIARGIKRNGKTLWLQRSVTRIDCLNKSLTLGNIIDVTAQRNAEIALECILCDKKRLSEKVLIAQESERKQIAGELHDSIGQSISAIKFGLENLLQNYGGALQEPVRQALSSTVGKLRGTIEDVRKISMNLRPSMLDDLGLLATISWFTREFRALFPDLDIELQIRVEEEDIPASLKVVIFRILQEALNNISKHAAADRVVVKLTCEGKRLEFSVADNGCGFTPDDMNGRWGFGLGSMRERATLSGGALDIESAPGDGTLLRAAWPCGW